MGSFCVPPGTVDILRTSWQSSGCDRDMVEEVTISANVGLIGDHDSKDAEQVGTRDFCR